MANDRQLQRRGNDVFIIWECQTRDRSRFQRLVSERSKIYRYALILGVFFRRNQLA
jgi:G:T-mismatch repair DNA endonuclease (very short patch repair protein)